MLLVMFISILCTLEPETKNRLHVRAVSIWLFRQEREKPAQLEWGVMLLRLLADELHGWKSGCVAPIVRKDNPHRQPAQVVLGRHSSNTHLQAKPVECAG